MGIITDFFDRRGLYAARARFVVRAVDGRVNNMGTDWSRGVAYLSAGRLHFEPKSGIVGSRQIDVLAMRADVPPVPADEGFEYFRLTTPEGELFGGFPAKLAVDVRALLLPVASATSSVTSELPNPSAP